LFAGSANIDDDTAASPFKVYTEMHYHFVQALPGMVALHALTKRLTTVTESGSTDTTEGYLKYLDMISLEQSQRDLQNIAEVRYDQYAQGA